MGVTSISIQGMLGLTLLGIIMYGWLTKFKRHLYKCTATQFSNGFQRNTCCLSTMRNRRIESNRSNGSFVRRYNNRTIRVVIWKVLQTKNFGSRRDADDDPFTPSILVGGAGVGAELVGSGVGSVTGASLTGAIVVIAVGTNTGARCL